MTCVTLYGTGIPPATPRVLRAGALSAELEDGALRAIRWHGIEILRGVNYLVRDPGWGTLPASLSNLFIEESDEAFAVSFEATVGDGYQYDAEIQGSADGRLSFEVTGMASANLETCRTGFVVLHPIEGVAGEPVEVGHADGGREETRFPRLISPAQPILSIESLTHRPVPGVTAVCRFEGDVFEMEDQRNWTDASYKTYVRPLSLPTPYTIQAGTRLTQAVRLEVTGQPTAPAQVRDGIGVTVGPALDLVMPPVGAGIDPLCLPKRAEPGLGLLVGRLAGARGDVETLRAYGDLARRAGAELFLELPLACDRPLDAELGEIAGRIDAAGVSVAGVTVAPAAYLKSYQPSGPWPEVPGFREVYRAARKAFPGVAIGGGVHAFFTELNRARPPVDEVDYVSFTTSPIVHAADERSIWESLESLPFVMETARSFCGGKPIRVGPSAIGMRDNPYGVAPVENPDNRRVAMARRDPRQRGTFGAAWYLGYAAALAYEGAASVALGALEGDFGFVGTPSQRVIVALAEAKGAPLLKVEVSGGKSVAALAWRTPAGPVLWLANGSPAAVRVDVVGHGAVEVPAGGVEGVALSTP
ncbi:hypothetical protein N825_30540 [Skermanella stibiiresistens SB22]|uniref:Uncharacterized protein n=1 Tax=Skermanella stibiiresistens SB22 TaxID=1385369 RepID=W9HAY8_9PROT|nr:hypothetical protein [Skermanella stibiiresistens]EWY41028.1 hypothetical protein N825_30540 [Skermanella stibiiresistens SB22]